MESNLKIIAVTQARISSTRLPGKVLKEIGGVPMLQMHLERLLRSKKLTHIIVATTNESGAEKICEIAERLNISIYKGSLTDVLDRYYNAVKQYMPDYVVRVTSDCPLIDAEVVDQVIEKAVRKNLDYVSNNLIHTFPDGLDVEVFKYGALEKAWRDATEPYDREHVTPYIRCNCTFNGGTVFTSDNDECNEGNYGNLSLTVDLAEELETIKILVDRFGRHMSWRVYADFVKSDESFKLNYSILRKQLRPS